MFFTQGYMQEYKTQLNTYDKIQMISSGRIFKAYLGSLKRKN